MSPRIPLSLILLLSLLSLTVNARPHPCDTVIISTFTFSIRPRLPIPHPEVSTIPLRPHSDSISFFPTDDLLPDLRPHRFPLHFHRTVPFSEIRADLPRPHPVQPQITDEGFLGFGPFSDRTKDVLSVLVSLVFGAACGVLTAMAVCLVWSLFNRRSDRSGEEFSSTDDDGDDYDDPESDVFNPKKNGYVAIPPPPVAEKADPVAAPAKESA